MAFSISINAEKLSTDIVEVLSAGAEIQTINADTDDSYLYLAYIDNTLNTGHPCYLKMWCGPYGNGDVANRVDITATDGTGLILGGATAAVATVTCHENISIDDQVIIISADDTSRTYIAKNASNYGANHFDRSPGGATAAAGTIICHADIATNDSVVIISADGTSKTYTAKAASNYGSNEFDASGNAEATATSLAAAIVHDGGHLDKLTVSRSTATLTITNVETGNSGNTTITNNLNVAATVTSFSGGKTDSDAIAVSLAAAIIHDGGHLGKLTTSRSDSTVTITNVVKGADGNKTIVSALNSEASVTSFAGGTDDSQVPSGTQEPDFIIYCPAGATAEYVFPQGIQYTEALKACIVTTPGKAGSTPMSNQVLFRLSLKES